MMPAGSRICESRRMRSGVEVRLGPARSGPYSLETRQLLHLFRHLRGMMAGDLPPAIFFGVGKGIAGLHLPWLSIAHQVKSVDPLVDGDIAEAGDMNLVQSSFRL